ncbi:hypothetical protein [Streptomyces sp. VRA16 Mangrove soil]|uniref:hypothetical protein n=1 Tax=Streptomyces sp. VRA16 Mangrove soil TaxID=2817434 RepID=UPI001A9DD8BF|nr:hypothetical protein [Streptomyces sp. VRA16 Mangrove soil]MBO1330684.1 hypothetical protein [Streptomyces sp. VRA16 Mangrove soil]
MNDDSAAPARYLLVLKARLTAADGHTDHGNPLRTVPVEATGEVGASGFPRFAGDGAEADIDPVTRTVEAVTVDGKELPYGWVAEAQDA